MGAPIDSIPTASDTQLVALLHQIQLEQDRRRELKAVKAAHDQAIQQARDIPKDVIGCTPIPGIGFAPGQVVICHDSDGLFENTGSWTELPPCGASPVTGWSPVTPEPDPEPESTDPQEATGA